MITHRYPDRCGLQHGDQGVRISKGGTIEGLSGAAVASERAVMQVPAAERRAPVGALTRGTLLALATTLVLWSSAFAGIRAGLVAYEPGQVALLHFLTASAALGIYAAVVRLRLPARRDLPAIFLAGLLGITLYNVLLSAGERSVTAGAASLLVNTGPIFTALLATALLRERLRAWGWAGIVVSFLGATLIALGQGDGLHLARGAILVLLAALVQALFFVRQKSLLATYRPLECTAYVIWAGVCWLLPSCPVCRRRWRRHRRARRAASKPRVAPQKP